jgi:hypothetical protein
MTKGVNKIKHWKEWGAIFSLTKHKWFGLKKEENSKVLKYEDNYLIFGNSEIRLREGEFQVYTAFGASSSYFDNKSEQQ